jgi:hypothetical protein
VTVFVLFLIAIWHPGHWRASENWLVTGWCCAAYGSLSFASLCGLRRLTIDWRWLGVVAAFFAWVIALIGVWGESEPAEKLIIVITSISVVFAHASLADLVPLKTGQQWLRLATITAVAASAAFLDLEVVFQPERGFSILGRISGAAAIIASCGSLALIIFARLNRVADEDSAGVDLTEITQMVLFCPRCHVRLTAAIGSDQCGECGLRIITAIEESAKTS